MARISNADIHGVFVRMLLKDYGIPKEHFDELVNLVDAIHEPHSFAHQHILMSIMGTQKSGRTSTIEEFLKEHQTKEPKHVKDARERRERQEQEESFRRRPDREPYYG